MTERREAAQRRRRTQAWIGGGIGAVLVIGAVIWVVVATSGSGKKPAATASASPSAAEASPAACKWVNRAQPDPAQPAQPLPPEIKNVGMPPTSGEPRQGSQTMTITTNLGVITVAVDTEHAPCTAASMTYLAGKKFYDNTPCHRMTTKQLYVLQCGDPSGTGSGGPSYQFAEENLPAGKRPAYAEGVLAMAKAQNPGTTSSQFFIVYKDTELQADYTVLGRVTAGLDIVKKVADAGVTPADPSNPDDGKPKTAISIKTLTMSAPTRS
jgi:peptidyl-prolyl cis-trans isomerase B (cyclophilin B)